MCMYNDNQSLNAINSRNWFCHLPDKHTHSTHSHATYSGANRGLECRLVSIKRELINGGRPPSSQISFAPLQSSHTPSPTPRTPNPTHQSAPAALHSKAPPLKLSC